MDSNHCIALLIGYCERGMKKKRPTPLLLVCTISCCLGLTVFCFYQSKDISKASQPTVTGNEQRKSPPCSSMPNNTMYCDRTAYRTDLCYLKGDVRAHSLSNSIILYFPTNSSSTLETVVERIKPYPRKWETRIMSTIAELAIRTKYRIPALRCDVRHAAAAIIFSTGGYTGNVYHDFNDGLIPLYITSRHFNKQVIFVILQRHDWWVSKYGNLLSLLSDYPPVDFSRDRRTHCFPEALIGLRIHEELAVDPLRMESNGSIRDFRGLLDEAFGSRTRTPEVEEASSGPKLVILSRNGSRGIENEAELVELAEKIGFRVEVVRPDRTSELSKLYRALNSSDAVVGVHGAALTHLLFMRPGSVFIQIVPLGTDWAAKVCYGEPARKMGLWYMAYEILPEESSLSSEYERSDPVLTDPMSVARKGWSVMKSVFLDKQTVRLNLLRFREHLVLAREYLEEKG